MEYRSFPPTFIIILFAFLFPAISHSQGGQKWGLSGNALSTTDFLGSTNAADLIFKAHNMEGFRLKTNGNVGIGIKNPAEKLEVYGNIKTSGNLHVNSIYLMGHIKSMNSEVHFGDSSIVVNSAYHNVYSTGNSEIGAYGGLGLGSFSARGKGISSVAIGYISQTDADYSFSLGSFLKTTYPNNGCIVIGKGVTNVQPLTGSISNSLFVGFNSTIPTLFVGPSAGAGTTGNVGIGTTTALSKLTVSAGAVTGISSTTKHIAPYKYNLQVVADGNTSVNADLTKAFSVRNALSGREDFIVYGDGRTAIGSPASIPGGYKLYVTGGILTERCRIAINGSTDWADHVFDANYKLMPLASLEAYLKQNKHLPGVPDACEVNENGYDITEMLATLLEKIEENTLYIIQLESQNLELQKQINKITQEIKLEK